MSPQEFTAFKQQLGFIPKQKPNDSSLVWLCTHQSIDVVKMLFKDKIICSNYYMSGAYEDDQTFAEDFFQRSYRWINEQMKDKKVQSLLPNPAWCWWAYASYYDSLTMRSNRRARFLDARTLQPRKPGILLELYIDPKRLLFSDYDLWHMVLNRSFIAKNEQAYQSYITQEPNHTRHKDNQIIQASWQHIFNLTRHGPCHFSLDPSMDPAYWGALDWRVVQATFWQLCAEDVYHMRPVFF